MQINLMNKLQLNLIFSLSVSAPQDVFSMFTLQIQNMPTRECCVKV